jgi:hypothetical protein
MAVFRVVGSGVPQANGWYRRGGASSTKTCYVKAGDEGAEIVLDRSAHTHYDAQPIRDASGTYIKVLVWEMRIRGRTGAMSAVYECQVTKALRPEPWEPWLPVLFPGQSDWVVALPLVDG